MERITIIGMGPVGTSIGLALKNARLKNTEVVGSSGDRQALSTASKMGAMDKSDGNLRSAIDGAQMIILDLPYGQMREMLNAIGPIVEDDCVITDTGTTKVRVIDWAESFLPKSVSFVGGNPLLKQIPASHEEADASLFQGIEYCVIPSTSADQQSVKTVVGLVELLGAKPLFLDPHEHDSYTAATAVLPMVLSSAFVTTASNSEAWREMHKLAAADFAEFSKYASNDPIDNEAACLANPDALVHWIDQYITELYSLRNKIKEGDDELIDSFIAAWEQRARWEAGVVADDGSTKLPGARESMATAFFGERLMNRYRNMTGGEDAKPWEYQRNG